jgi:hypothetical protein
VLLELLKPCHIKNNEGWERPKKNISPRNFHFEFKIIGLYTNNNYFYPNSKKFLVEILVPVMLR